MADILALVGARLRGLRKDRGLSQAEVASRANLQETYLGAVERGQRNISLKTLERIAEALGVDEIEAFRFGEIDTDAELIEKADLVLAHKSMLSERSIGEVRMVNRIVRDILATYDEERSGKK